MTLSEFINLSSAIDKGNGNFEVEITLKNKDKVPMWVYNCSSEYEAKEKVYLYLVELIDIARKTKQN
jgi:hypothetical protein